MIKKTKSKPGACSSGETGQAMQAELRAIIDLAADFYWEQDEQHRFTYYRLRDQDSIRDGDPLAILGKTSWDFGDIPEEDGGSWAAHLAVREARQPFSNLVTRATAADGTVRIITVSGIPHFDARGSFRGYRGIARDISRERRTEQLLQLEYDVMRLMAGAERGAEGLTGAIRSICESQGWEAGAHWKLDEPAGLMRFDVGWSSARTPMTAAIMLMARNVTFRPGEGLPGWTWQTGKLLWVSDIMSDPRVSSVEVSEKTGWNSALLFPITVEGKIVGILDFYAPRIAEPDEALLRVVRILGTEIGHYYRRAVALEQLRASEARFRSLTELSSDWYWEQDADLRFTRFESRDAEFVSSLKQWYLGKRIWETGFTPGAGPEQDPMRALLESRKPFRDAVIRRVLPDGSRRFFSVSGEPIYDADGRFAGYRGLTRDVSATKEVEERVQHLATHDGLTDLSNRFMFGQVLGAAVKSALRYKRGFALLFIDIDGFKFINDSLGHDAGDLVLKEVANRLRSCVRSSDTVARLGGDEFVVLVEEIRERQQVATVAQNLLAAAGRIVPLQGHDCRVTLSIGISLFPEDARDEQSLMKNADLAMYHAKSTGKNNFQFYSADIRLRPAR